MICSLSGFFRAMPPLCPETGYAMPMTGLTQPWHIVLILLIAVLLFGGKRLPEIGRSLGTGMREFKDSITGNHPAEPQQQLTPPEPAEHDNL
jgi:sec-independent protein translocase protein TatA